MARSCKGQSHLLPQSLEHRPHFAQRFRRNSLTRVGRRTRRHLLLLRTGGGGVGGGSDGGGGDRGGGAYPTFADPCSVANAAADPCSVSAALFAVAVALASIAGDGGGGDGGGGDGAILAAGSDSRRRFHAGCSAPRFALCVVALARHPRSLSHCNFGPRKRRLWMEAGARCREPPGHSRDALR